MSKTVSCLAIVSAILLNSQRATGIESVIESFDGDGPFTSTGLVFDGFDLPDWELYSAPFEEFIEFNDAGLAFDLPPGSSDLEAVVSRNIARHGVLERIVIKDFSIGIMNEDAGSDAGLTLLNALNSSPESTIEVGVGATKLLFATNE